MIVTTLQSPWLERDQWLTAEGPWRDPNSLVGSDGNPISDRALQTVGGMVGNLKSSKGGARPKPLKITNSSVRLLRDMERQTAHTAKEWLAQEVAKAQAGRFVTSCMSLAMGHTA